MQNVLFVKIVVLPLQNDPQLYSDCPPAAIQRKHHFFGHRAKQKHNIRKKCGDLKLHVYPLAGLYNRGKNKRVNIYFLGMFSSYRIIVVAALRQYSVDVVPI